MTNIKLLSGKREEFRRVCRAHPDWISAREAVGAKKNPSTAQWLEIGELLGIDMAPFTMSRDIKPRQSWHDEPATDKQVAALGRELRPMMAQWLEDGADIKDATADMAAAIWRHSVAKTWEITDAEMRTLAQWFAAGDYTTHLLTTSANDGVSKFAASLAIDYLRTDSGEDDGDEPTPAPTPDNSNNQEAPDMPDTAPAPATAPATAPAGTDPLTAALRAAMADIAATTAAPVDEARVIELIKEHAPEPEPAYRGVTVQVGNRPAVQIDGDVHPAFDDCLAVLAAGENLQMVGPAGSGKTTLAMQLAKALGLEFGMTGAVEQAFALMGYKNAAGEYQETEFFRRYTAGGVFLFDEFDGSLPNAVLPFNGALANNMHDFPHGNYSRHADFLAIAACNTWGRGADRQYVGRYQQDGAALDRWIVVPVDYDEALETKISGNPEWSDTVQALRAAMFDLGIQHIISPRASIKGAKLLAAGMDQTKVLDYVVWKGLDAPTVAKIRDKAGV